ncbi:hypothetical protein ACFQS1_35870 [Paractinoplanes rhizophilus]|uniref:SnoaL-like domain-containing protein n=1 Tax=Paractinoplanes rhizophilus TaxID=1416877 RepID=A0ABW2I3E0_9ACTN
MQATLVTATFLTAVCARDIAALAACLHPLVRLRALLPDDAVVRVGPAAVAGRFGVWLGGWDDAEVLRSEMWQVAGRSAVAYRLVLRDRAGPTMELEHQLYCDVADGRLRAIDLLGVGPGHSDHAVARR